MPEYRYMKMATARKKQRSMKRMYGYKPSIFKETHPQKKGYVRYVVVKPKGLRKI